MNAYYLHKPDGSRAGYCVCGECGQLALDANWDVSEKCCTCYECKKPLGKEKYAKNIIHCRECELRLRREREQAALDRAELVTDYDGPVSFGESGGSMGEGYFANVEELIDHLDSEDEDGAPRPKFVFCCKEYPFKGLQVDHLLESVTEEMYDDAIEDLDGVHELEIALKAFNEANKGRISFFADNKRKVALPELPKGAETPDAQREG